MKIAFYAPLKSPDHPVPSGDRLMARQLWKALERGGHEVKLVSDLRSFSATPDVPEELIRQARDESERIATDFAKNGKPDLWFCYHPYYKSPDLLGPALCQQHGIAYVTAESSYSQRRNIGGWARSQQKVLEGIRLAKVNICLTQRDRQGLLHAQPDARCAYVPPFIDTEPFLTVQPEPVPGNLVTIAMMRAGDKLSSYEALAKALKRLAAEEWTLTVVGDGPVAEAVRELFAPLGERVRFDGQLPPDKIVSVLKTGALYLWPGHGEAYGLAYLEAQAAGLAVVAEGVAGVPEVVHHKVSGLLTAPGDTDAYANAIRQLLRDDKYRKQLSENARHMAQERHSLDAASRDINRILAEALECGNE
ncbi:glycosyltransferase family 4 protein [Rhizobium helianthi]|uniref:Glycosyltransferase family 4 protein n=1 Tax=Rhizobium helianthi TaxID=1132695 RepID=A0ABW4M224_9HYPH